MVATPVLTSEASHGITTVIKNRNAYQKLREDFHQIHSGLLQSNKNSRLLCHIETIGSPGCVKATLLESKHLKTGKNDLRLRWAMVLFRHVKVCCSILYTKEKPRLDIL